MVAAREKEAVWTLSWLRVLVSLAWLSPIVFPSLVYVHKKSSCSSGTFSLSKFYQNEGKEQLYAVHSSPCFPFPFPPVFGNALFLQVFTPSKLVPGWDRSSLLGRNCSQKLKPETYLETGGDIIRLPINQNPSKRRFISMRWLTKRNHLL